MPTASTESLQLPEPIRRKQRLKLSFGLQTMFVVVLLLSIPLGWLAWQIQTVRERKAILAEIGGTWRGNSRQLGILEELEQERLNSWCGTYDNSDREYIRVSQLRKLLGDVSVSYIAISPRKGDTRESVLPFVRRIEKAFPEAVLSAGHSNYRDSLYKPMNERKPNKGTLFTTGKFD